MWGKWTYSSLNSWNFLLARMWREGLSRLQRDGGESELTRPSDQELVDEARKAPRPEWGPAAKIVVLWWLKRWPIGEATAWRAWKRLKHLIVNDSK